jgi:hypothetical protein
VAERRGWEVVQEYSDHGISGAQDRDKRPAFDRMLKGATRREYDMIAAVGQGNRGDAGQADGVADDGRGAGADEDEGEGANQFRKELGCNSIGHT